MTIKKATDNLRPGPPVTGCHAPTPSAASASRIEILLPDNSLSAMFDVRRTVSPFDAPSWRLLLQQKLQVLLDCPSLIQYWIESLAAKKLHPPKHHE